MNQDYLMERELKKRNPLLLARFRKSVSLLPAILSRYQMIFPTYTDHTELHSMNVLAFCNSIIGQENIRRMNEDEIYCLLMAIYLHDSGMGCRDKDYLPFLQEIDPRYYPPNLDPADRVNTIRILHHEFSALFVRKYAMLFDFPSEEHCFAVQEICRGHRKTDLYDEGEYPRAFPLPTGNTVCLPYLSALIRLADEIDMTADRNSTLLYDASVFTDERDIMIWDIHEALQSMRIEEDSFVFQVKAKNPKNLKDVEDYVGKMQKTLDYCREVILQITPFKISQKSISMVTV